MRNNGIKVSILNDPKKLHSGSWIIPNNIAAE